MSEIPTPENTTTPGPLSSEPTNPEMSASVPLMITRDMRKQLNDIGIDDVAVNNYRPEEAWDIIKGFNTKEAEAEQTQSTVLEAKDLKVEGPTKEATPEAKLVAKTPEMSADNVASFLNTENKGFFGKMSETGKNIVKQAYETISKATGADVAVGKMKIAYSQYWMDSYEQKSVALKGKMDGCDAKAGVLDQSKSQIASAIEDLKAQDIPGFESLQLKLKEIDSKKAELQNQKNFAQSELEAQKNQASLLTNERDRVASELIGRYDEKLEPIEKELEALNTNRDQVDLLATVAEVRLQEESDRLGKIKKQKDTLESAFRNSGMKDGEIRRNEVIQTLTGIFESGQKSIKAERDVIAKRKAEINAKIARVDAKANPYRDKREEYIRVKDSRPLNIEVKPRSKLREPTYVAEQAQGNTRIEDEQENQAEGGGISTVSPESEAVKENVEKLKAIDLVNLWNSFLKEEYKGDNGKVARELLDPKDFLKAIKLLQSFRLEFKDFRNILGKYYKLRKIPLDKFNRHIDRLYAVKIKAK